MTTNKIYEYQAENNYAKTLSTSVSSVQKNLVNFRILQNTDNETYVLNSKTTTQNNIDANQYYSMLIVRLGMRKDISKVTPKERKDFKKDILTLVTDKNSNNKNITWSNNKLDLVNLPSSKQVSPNTQEAAIENFSQTDTPKKISWGRKFLNFLDRLEYGG